MPSENLAGAETETEATRAGIESLGELLAESEPAEPERESEESGDAAELKKFNDLAERLGVDLDTLYSLEVSQADDGTPVTIERLKDDYAKRGDFDLREIEFEERRSQREAELMQAQNELRELMGALPETAIKPEVLQKLRDKQAAQVELEKRRTLEVIPEWQDESRRTQEITGMVEHLQQYGYPANHLEHVTDHRQLKYIRDNWAREQRIRSALDKVRAGRPNPTPPQKPVGKPPSKRPLTGVKRGNSRDKLEAIFSDL